MTLEHDAASDAAEPALRRDSASRTPLRLLCRFRVHPSFALFASVCYSRGVPRRVTTIDGISIYAVPWELLASSRLVERLRCSRWSVLARTLGSFRQ